MKTTKRKPLPKVTGQEVLDLLKLVLDSGITFSHLHVEEREKALALVETGLKTALPGLMTHHLPRTYVELDTMVGAVRDKAARSR
jgi:hypothetical protein